MSCDELLDISNTMPACEMTVFGGRISKWFDEVCEEWLRFSTSKGMPNFNLSGLLSGDFIPDMVILQETDLLLQKLTFQGWEGE